MLTMEEVDDMIAISGFHGPICNGSADNVFSMPVRSPKPIAAFVAYVQARRAEHNDVTVFLSFDNSPFMRAQ